MCNVVLSYTADILIVLSAKRQTPSEVSTSTSASSFKLIEAPVIIDLTSLGDESDMELESDIEDEPSAPLAFANVGPPPESARSSAERLMREEREDRCDEDYLEKMLLAGD